MSLLGKIASVALKPSVAIGNAISNVIKSGSGKTTSAQLAATPAGKALGGAIAATGAALAVAALPAGTAAAVGRAIVQTAAANPIKTAIAAPIVAGIISSNPLAPVKAASNLATFGSNVGEFTKAPSLESAANIVKESPIISAGLAAAGLTELGAGILPTLSNIQNTRAVKENTIATLASSIPAEAKETLISGDKAAIQPLTPATQTLSTGTSRKRSKTRYKAQQQKISQSVRVNVINSQRTNKYINRSIYAR